MNLMVTLVFTVSGAVGQGALSSDVEIRYEAYRRAGLAAFLQANYKQAENDFMDALAEARIFGPFDPRVPNGVS